MIIVKLKGGMGNQMFQYALGRYLSIKNNTSLGLDLAFLKDRTPRSNFTFRDYDLDVFNIEAEIIDQSKVPFIHKHFKGKFGLYFDYFKRKFLRLKGVERNFGFDGSILYFGDNIYLDGYWQSPKYFEKIENIIKQDFTLKNELPIKIKNLIEIIEKENSVCIHIRRGDYVGSSYYEIVDESYYKKALLKIKSLSKIDKIYVFSDDIKWCEKNIKFEFPTMYVGEEYAGIKAEGHFSLMINCKHFIIPNSSFSWWAAWRSESKEKIVIVPKQWFGDKSINSEDLIPEKWIRI